MAPLLRRGGYELLQPHRLYEWLREDPCRPSGDLLRGGESALHPARSRRHLVRPQGDGRCGEIHQQRHDRDAPRAGRCLLPLFTCAGGGYPLHGLDVCDADLQYHGLLLCGAVHGAGSRARLFAPAGEAGTLDPRRLCDLLRDPCDRSALRLSDAAAFGNHGGRVPLLGAGALTSDLLPAGECIRLLRDADILLGHFRKLPDEYGRPVQAEG